MRKILLISFLTFFVDSLSAQGLSNLRNKYIQTGTDSIQLDTLSIIPGSFYIIEKSGQVLDSSFYILDEIEGKFIWKTKPDADSLKATYRVFSFLLSEPFFHKDAGLVTKGIATNPFLYNPGNKQAELFKVPGLNRSGSILHLAIIRMSS